MTAKSRGKNLVRNQDKPKISLNRKHSLFLSDKSPLVHELQPMGHRSTPSPKSVEPSGTSVPGLHQQRSLATDCSSHMQKHSPSHLHAHAPVASKARGLASVRGRLTSQKMKWILPLGLNRINLKLESVSAVCQHRIHLAG